MQLQFPACGSPEDAKCVTAPVGYTSAVCLGPVALVVLDKTRHGTVAILIEKSRRLLEFYFDQEGEALHFIDGILRASTTVNGRVLTHVPAEEHVLGGSALWVDKKTVCNRTKWWTGTLADGPTALVLYFFDGATFSYEATAEGVQKAYKILTED